MKKIYSAIIGTLLLLALCGCDEMKLVTFHIANSRSISSSSSNVTEKMPSSDFAVATQSEHFMYSADLIGVSLGQVTLPDNSKQIGFIFQCGQRGKNRLFRATASNMGAFIVAKYNGQIIGLRKIDTAIGDGVLFIVNECPADTDLHKKVAEMNEDIKNVNEFTSSMK